MDSPDWRAAVARAKRLGIEAYQAGRVKLDASQATTVLVERVTSNEAWGPTSKDCAAIADLTYDLVEAPKAMEVIWRRLSGDAAAGARNWRKLHKTLTLLDYLLKHASVGVIDEASSHAMTFAALSRFCAPRAAPGASAAASLGAGDADEGCRLVREKASALLKLLDDTDALRRCRAEAQRSAGRFVGIGRDATGGSRRTLSFGSDDAEARSSASRGVTIATAGAARVRPFSLAGSSISARSAFDDSTTSSFKAYSPPREVTPSDGGTAIGAKPMPTIAPPPPSAFGPWTAARFASLSAPPAPPAPSASYDPFADFAGVGVAAPPPAEATGAAFAAESSAGAGAGAASGDPFASLLDDVDELSAANKGASTEPLCAIAAEVWNVGGAPSANAAAAPDVGALLASAAPPPPASAAAGESLDAFMFEEARLRLAAVQLTPAAWGPGSSLSPRTQQQPALPVVAPVFRAAQPALPNLIDL